MKNKLSFFDWWLSETSMFRKLLLPFVFILTAVFWVGIFTADPKEVFDNSESKFWIAITLSVTIVASLGVIISLYSDYKNYNR
jgi:hypothetical protein